MKISTEYVIVCLLEECHEILVQADISVAQVRVNHFESMLKHMLECIRPKVAGELAGNDTLELVSFDTATKTWHLETDEE